MKSPHNGLWHCALALIFVVPAMAQNEEPSRIPTWQDEIAKGFVPHHQLTVDDFRIDDKTHPEGSYWVKPFIHPYWHYILRANDGWYYAYVDQWIIFSGFDKNDSTRKSKFREMQKSLPHAQAYLDLNEIYGRQLAALKPGELPSGRGATQREAATALKQSLQAFLKEKYRPLDAEEQEFQKATNHGTNTKKVLELAHAIRKRLDTIPAPTAAPCDSLTAPPSQSPAPQPSATPNK